ncbi:MAG TPA: outer membrane beta-barrel protein [Pyrinomonadaceae bacterium]|jgi:opacity protein-like surface antigen
MRKTLCSLVLLLAATLSIVAQETPKAEVFGGYSWAGGNFHGWNTSVTGNVNKWFGVTADFSGHYGSEQFGALEEKQRGLSFLAGPRFTLRRGKRFTPFAYALFGGVNYRVSLEAAGQHVASASDTGFNMALGGGLDIKVNDRVAVRAFQIDYFRPHFFGESHNRGRLAFGLVLRFGKK